MDLPDKIFDKSDTLKLKEFENAVESGDLDKVRMMVEKGMNVDQRLTVYNMTALTIAARHDHLNLVEFLVENGADINHDDGETALMIASRQGRLDIVKFLIERGADIDYKEEFGNTALSAATVYGRLDIMKFLIEHGADVNVRSGDDHLSLMEIATLNKHNHVQHYLSSLGKCEIMR